MLLAFDDTDSPSGGCTSHLVLHVLAALPGLAPRSLPRLVRLNPNVPWKTRGNAAVCLDLGVPHGPMARAGEWRGLELRVYPEGRPAPARPQDLDAAWHAIAQVAQAGADPAVVAVDEPLPAALYWQAVRTVVEPAAVEGLLTDCGALWKAGGDGRGIVGAGAAAAWPGPPSSFEFTAYREPARWGTARQVEKGGLAGLDATGATFHTWDAAAGRAACVPRTPCPVLLGLRGLEPEALRAAALATLPRLAAESIDAWVLWATNQASGDHVTPVAALAEAPTLGTAQLAATVSEPPVTGRGGHTSVALEDGGGARFSAVAYEPTHAFRDVVRGLAPGDRVTAVGALGPRGLRLEKLRIDSLASRRMKAANPPCPTCGRSMKSRGAGAGYRCPDGHAKSPPGSEVWQEREATVALGWHEVPVMARRHLHRPIGFG